MSQCDPCGIQYRDCNSCKSSNTYCGWCDNQCWATVQPYTGAIGQAPLECQTGSSTSASLFRDYPTQTCPSNGTFTPASPCISCSPQYYLNTTTGTCMLCPYGLISPPGSTNISQCNQLYMCHFPSSSGCSFSNVYRCWVVTLNISVGYITDGTGALQNTTYFVNVTQSSSSPGSYNYKFCTDAQCKTQLSAYYIQALQTCNSVSLSGVTVR